MHVIMQSGRHAVIMQSGHHAVIKTSTSHTNIAGSHLKIELMLTGDILIGRRFTGDAAEQMILSGGYASHAAMIVEDNQGGRSKYVIDCPSDMGLLNRSGVRMTELNNWFN